MSALREKYLGMDEDLLMNFAINEAHNLTDEGAALLLEALIERGFNEEIIANIKKQRKEYTLEE
jgi:hypothetical protein